MLDTLTLLTRLFGSTLSEELNIPSLNYYQHTSPSQSCRTDTKN